MDLQKLMRHNLLKLAKDFGITDVSDITPKAIVIEKLEPFFMSFRDASLLDVIAMNALPTIIKEYGNFDADQIANTAYKIAKSMMKIKTNNYESKA